AIENSQKKVEGRNFDIRKQLLKFDDVMNDQRKVIYEQRRELMEVDEVTETVSSMRHEVIADMVESNLPAKVMHEQWDIENLHAECLKALNVDLPINEWVAEEGVDEKIIEERILDASDRKMAEKAANFGPEIMRMVEKSMLLQILDQTWKEHLLGLDYLRHTISLRAYGQKDPLNEYKKEAFSMFGNMLDLVRERVTNVLSMVQIHAEPAPDSLEPSMPSNVRQIHETPEQAVGESSEKEASKSQPFRYAKGENLNAEDPSTWGKIARNASCPCGSGKKYKHCHGRIN
ncbi:MAG: SEC-C domain-containing protein, partial [Alphaproteobacteria bacterium]|nr:SEC-C domain-containing protein [Alphaproteobacteria bacterium]